MNNLKVARTWWSTSKWTIRTHNPLPAKAYVEAWKLSEHPFLQIGKQRIPSVGSILQFQAVVHISRNMPTRQMNTRKLSTAQRSGKLTLAGFSIYDLSQQTTLACAEGTCPISTMQHAIGVQTALFALSRSVYRAEQHLASSRSEKIRSASSGISGRLLPLHSSE